MLKPDSNFQLASVSDLSQEEVLALINQTITKKEKKLFFPLNLHICAELIQDAALAKRYKQVDLVFADGVPLLWWLAFRGRRLSGRVSGTEVTQALLENSNLKLFIVASHEKIAQSIQDKFTNVVAYSVPPFGSKWNKIVDQKIVNKINEVRPDVVLIGISPPKQEKWLLDNFKKLKANVGIPIGSALEIIAGEKKRAPKIMQHVGLEWLWRVMLEPRRLLPRYANDIYQLVKFSVQK